MTLLCFLAACASPSGPELIAENLEKKEEQKVEQIEKNVENVPQWYLTPPDGKGVVGYFVGQGESSSIQVAKGFPMRTFFFFCKSFFAIPRTIADLPLNGSHEPINNISLII